eukprot:gene10039-13497_t
MSTWMPFRKTMHRYCEPYCAAITNWSLYSNEKHIANRFAILDSVHDMLMNLTNDGNEYLFRLVLETPCELLPEVLPTVPQFEVNGDRQAFEYAKQQTNPIIFSCAGSYFQRLTLKALSGFCEQALVSQNFRTRKIIISSVFETLLRVPEAAGMVHVQYALLSDGVYYDYPREPVPLTEEAKLCLSKIIDFRKETKLMQECIAEVEREKAELASIIAAQEKEKELEQKRLKSIAKKEKRKQKNKDTIQIHSNEKKNRDKSNKNKNDEIYDYGAHLLEEDDEVVWLTEHESVGVKVAAFFPDPLYYFSGLPKEAIDEETKLEMEKKKPYVGQVVKYAPPTTSKHKNQLYHILWEDGDEQDYDEDEFLIGQELFEHLDEWTTDHESVGIRVAQYFPMNAKKNSSLKAFVGVVTRYQRPSDATSNDQLYHILWKDGDQQDFDQQELNEATALYKLLYTRKSTTLIPVDSVLSASSLINEKSGKSSNDALLENSSVTVTTKESNNHDNSSIAESNVKRLDAKEMSQHHNKDKYDNPSDKNEGVQTKQNQSLHDNNKNTNKSNGSNSKPKSNAAVEEIQWTSSHAIIGKRVAQYFEIRLGKEKSSKYGLKPFFGTVLKYAPPSKPRLRDQIYHIAWEDGDECDYDETELTKGLQLADSLINPLSQNKSDSNISVIQTNAVTSSLVNQRKRKTETNISSNEKLKKLETDKVEESTDSQIVSLFVEDKTDVVDSIISNGISESVPEVVHEEAMNYDDFNSTLNKNEQIDVDAIMNDAIMNNDDQFVEENNEIINEDEYNMIGEDEDYDADDVTTEQLVEEDLVDRPHPEIINEFRGSPPTLKQVTKQTSRKILQKVTVDLNEYMDEDGHDVDNVDEVDDVMK